MKYAIVQGNKVVNVAVSDQAIGPNWIASETARIGDEYINGTFIRPPTPDPASYRVSVYQLMMAIDQAGHIGAFDAYVQGLPRGLRILWEKSRYINSASAPAAAMRVALGLTPGQLRDLFKAAQVVAED